MGQYRISRNMESSIIEFLQSEIDNDWTDISVEKTFAEIYGIDLPSVCVRVGTTGHDSVEIGSNSTKREAQVLIDIFGSNDGIRLDLKDYIIEKIKNGLVYYEYTIVNGQIQSKVQNGRITILTIEDAPLNFDVEKNALDVHDRYRHILTLTVNINQVEV